MSKLRGFTVYPLIFLIGGISYCVLELVFRGRTHWSMLLAGGLCVVSLYLIAAKSRAPAWKKWLAAGAVITTIEYITGVFVNILMGWNVWDYSTRGMNLLGQICPLFTLVWVLLSIPVIWFLGYIDVRFISKEVAEYDGTDGY